MPSRLAAVEAANGGGTDYSGDSLKWRTHLIGALGPFWKVWKTHLNGAPKIQNFDTEMCLKELKNEEKQTKTGEHQKKMKIHLNGALT